MLMNEMSNRENTKHGGLSVVARLMGMDTLPPEIIPTTYVTESYDERLRQSISRITCCESAKGTSIQLPSTTFNQTEDKLPLNWKKRHSKPTKSPISTTPFGREHPQEEQLQKFKKEFEAWQDSKLWEFSSHLVQNNSIEGLKKEQILALANLNKEKIAGYTNTHTSVNKFKFTPNQFHGFQHDNNFSKHLMPQAKNEMPIRRELASKSFEPASTAKFHEKISTPCSPSRIVILKSFSNNDELEGPRGGSIEDFLEEVKERLRFEFEGKGRNDSFRRLSSAHSSLQECLTYPKQLTPLVGKHIKENEATMGRSESMSSYRTEFHFEGQEFDKSTRERRKFITDKWENLLKNDSELEKAMLDDGRSVKFPSTKEKVIPKHFSHEQVKRELVDNETMSHPKLIRSFSAPASRSATVTQNFQQHEDLKNISAVVNKGKKYGFNIKGKVSNLRRTFSLKGNFFGKKASLIWDSTVDTLSYMEPNQTMPLVVGNFGVVQDNPTEVPPSPASFPCSPMSVHHSPVSPLEVPFVEDNSSTQVSGELSTTLPGANFHEVQVIEDHGEAYVRDILLLLGLDETWPFDQALTRLEEQMNTIPSCVFDEVEENYRKNWTSSDVDCFAVNLRGIDVDRKMLFDLVNQALSSLKDDPMHGLVSERARFPRERKLLGDLLDRIQMYVRPAIDQPHSTDDIVVWDVKPMPLWTASRENINSVGWEVEREIVGDLIGEFVLDLSVCSPNDTRCINFQHCPEIYLRREHHVLPLSAGFNLDSTELMGKTCFAGSH
ncbi:hypothetical protein KSP40_PGU015288 [Platanthera guangdongensis]|uniref:DUF4378 domain-containing protein n=1 Tax=Platanthera guangdongensis TaxID=2320717 RepID=A0ABR2M1L7_9ASPA